MWYVEVAEYLGDGYWADYPPLSFTSEAEARTYAGLMTGVNVKVRRVYQKEVA